ncbi:DUF1003 domain-containing protein [Afifella aestuarii]|uniref:DUF1003 domain-containing protein n=1 Tax=Afifella aestuarii TaxID=1909496 RepID=UPI000FE2B5AB|nr:DUF1003 domain-containing protein [Afifella aestuarii]
MERADAPPQSGAKSPTCVVCGKSLRQERAVPWAAVRPAISALIGRDHPQWSEGSWICPEDLETYRRRSLRELLSDANGDLGPLEQEVLDSLKTGDIVTAAPDITFDERATFGDRMADRVAAFGGSWTFILSFSLVCGLWMMLNVTGWLFKPFDAYPFILLNLVLSTLAAIQAPIIMMSQRRQEARDRMRAQNDYQVNLKAELEVRQLHEKIDHQLSQQSSRLERLERLQEKIIDRITS